MSQYFGEYMMGLGELLRAQVESFCGYLLPLQRWRCRRYFGCVVLLFSRKALNEAAS